MKHIKRRHLALRDADGFGPSYDDPSPPWRNILTSIRSIISSIRIGIYASALGGKKIRGGGGVDDDDAYFFLVRIRHSHTQGIQRLGKRRKISQRQISLSYPQ